MGFPCWVWSFLRPLRSRQFDASHREDGSQGFEQVEDGNGAASLFAATQGGPLVAPVSGICPIYLTDPIPGMATPYSQQASAGAEYLLAKNLTLRAEYLFVHGVKAASNA